jgi:hypothetical protein
MPNLNAGDGRFWDCEDWCDGMGWDVNDWIQFLMDGRMRVPQTTIMNSRTMIDYLGKGIKMN